MVNGGDGGVDQFDCHHNLMERREEKRREEKRREEKRREEKRR